MGQVLAYVPRRLVKHQPFLYLFSFDKKIVLVSLPHGRRQRRYVRRIWVYWCRVRLYCLQLRQMRLNLIRLFLPTSCIQNFGRVPFFREQRGLKLRLRESHRLQLEHNLVHFLELVNVLDLQILFWSNIAETHMRLLSVTECCKSKKSQSGRQSHSESVTFRIIFRNSWVSVELGS